jgi:MinD superfamily P-loop ATPase
MTGRRGDSDECCEGCISCNKACPNRMVNPARQFAGETADAHSEVMVWQISPDMGLKIRSATV